jgi:hypothetical protein
MEVSHTNKMGASILHKNSIFVLKRQKITT